MGAVNSPLRLTKDGGVMVGFLGQVNMTRAGLRCALTLIFSSAVVDLATAAVSIDPHRAIYDAALKWTDGSITDIQGRMVFEWQDSCKGWAVRQRYVLRFFGDNGNSQDIKTAYESWEDKSGAIYRFNVKHGGTGSRQETLEGFANRTGPESRRNGQAVFTSHDDETFTLPGGTFFPSGHTISLIDHASRGKKFLMADVFDGSKREGSVYVSAVIGQEALSTRKKWPEIPAQYWPMQLAFYDEDAAMGLPSYEFAVHLHANGVMSDMTLEYQDYSLSLKLVDFEKLLPERC